MLVRETPLILSNPLRMLACTVILASIAASVVIELLVSSNFHSRNVESLLIEGLAASVLVSVVGGLWLASATKNAWSLLALLPAFGGFGLWLLFSMMSPVTFH